MNNYTQSRKEEISNIVTKARELSFEDVFSFAEEVIKMNNKVTPYKQIERYIMNESHRSTHYSYSDFEKEIKSLCEKNILPWIHLDEQEKVVPEKNNKDLKYEDLRLFSNGTRGGLPQIIAELKKYDKIYYDVKERKKYEEKCLKKLKELDKYKVDKEKWESNGMVGEEPKRPIMPTLRKIKRYELLFFCFVFNCNVEQAELLLYKVCNQRGFNFKNPLDLLCYCGLNNKTNKYGTFIKIRNAFCRAEINPKSVSENDTMHIRSVAEEKINAIDYENLNVEEIVDIIVNTMELSNKLYGKIHSGQDVINYYFGYTDIDGIRYGGHSKNPDCLTYSSFSARREFFYLLGLIDLLDERRNLSEQIDECYERLKNTRKQIKNESLTTARRENLKKECEKYDERIKSLFDISDKLTEENVFEDFSSSYNDNDFVLDNFIEKGEELSATVNSIPLYKLKAKGKFGETALNKKIIKDFVSGSRTVNKENLILAYLFYFCQTEDFLEREKTDNTVIDSFESGVNASLKRAGFGDFYIVNPYEALIMLSLFTIDPLETLAEITYMKNAKNNAFVINNDEKEYACVC